MNLRTKHTRGQRGVRQAGIIEIEGYDGCVERDGRLPEVR